MATTAVFVAQAYTVRMLRHCKVQRGNGVTGQRYGYSPAPLVLCFWTPALPVKQSAHKCHAQFRSHHIGQHIIQTHWHFVVVKFDDHEIALIDAT